MIIREDELLKTFKDIQLIPSKLKKIRDKSIIVELDCQSFYNLCQTQNNRLVFYQYLYYDKEEYLITEDLIKETTFSRKEYIFCKERADKYNETTSKIDFGRPVALYLATRIDSEWIVSAEYDDWLPDDVLTAEDALIKFKDENENTINELSDKKESDESLITELESILLADKEFRFCTNKRMRFQYVKSFIAKESNHKFLKLCADVRDESNRVFKLSSIFDRIYTEYRNNCYALKIQVGNPLPKNKG